MFAYRGASENVSFVGSQKTRVNVLRKSLVNDAVQFVRIRLCWFQVNTLSREQSGGRRIDCDLGSFFLITSS